MSAHRLARIMKRHSGWFLLAGLALISLFLVQSLAGQRSTGNNTGMGGLVNLKAITPEELQAKKPEIIGLKYVEDEGDAKYSEYMEATPAVKVCRPVFCHGLIVCSLSPGPCCPRAPASRSPACSGPW